MPADWKQYQEDAATFFRSLGLNASADVTVTGVRTTHDVDVLVESFHVGFKVTWLVECKKWRTPVSKLHVLALREIVADTGADRGILLSEAGFQSGAVEAARLTNVQVTSLASLESSTRNDIYALRLREIYDRVETCNDLYWDIPKEVRIDGGLRPDVSFPGYSGARVIDAAREILSRAFRGIFPFDTSWTALMVEPPLPRSIESVEQAVCILEPMVTELEKRLREVTNVECKEN